jgi:hypothetical protein
VKQQKQKVKSQKAKVKVKSDSVGGYPAVFDGACGAIRHAEPEARRTELLLAFAF